MASIHRKTGRVAAVLLLALAAACDDTAGTLAAPEVRGLLLPQSQFISCTATVAGGGSVSCGSSGSMVQVAVANPTVASGKLEFDVTVKNLIPQPIGTEDGTTPHVEGVRVFFKSGPTVTQGSGLVTVANKDGTDSFTGGLEPYFHYAAVLDSGEVSSARRWRLSFSPLVQGFTFSLGVSAAVPFPDGWVDVSPRVDTLVAGDSVALAATVRDAYGAAVPGAPVTWSGSGSAASVSAAGVVKGLAAGAVTAAATSGTRAGSAAVTVVPAPCVLPAVGAVHAPGSSSSVCLEGGASGAEYVVVPVNVSPSADALLTVTATGIVPLTAGGPSPGRAPARTPPEGAARTSSAEAAEAWEARLRRMERGTLTERIGAARSAFRAGAAGARRAIVPGVPAVGDRMMLNVETDNTCSTSDLRRGRVVAVGAHVIVMADTANPAGGLTTADYGDIADRFDALVWPTVTGTFGVPSDIDGNGRVIAFFTRAVNELTPPSSSPVTDGFVLRRDLFDGASCATSNVGEVVFLAAADPAGTVNGNVRPAHSVEAAAARTLGHELAHLVNASRRVHVNFAPVFEETWLDEGLAQVAEELLYHAAASAQPRQNLGASLLATGRSPFLSYAEPNFSRLRSWLLSPHASGLFQADDDRATRGAAWAFLRYAADRRGGTESAFWSALANATTAGMTNLEAVLGADADPWIRDFAVATYADDAGLGAAGVYTQPSWAFRSLYPELGYGGATGIYGRFSPGGGGSGCICGDVPAAGYPLAVRDPANGAATAFTLARGGASAYLRVRVPANGSATVALQSGGGAPPATVLLAVIRRK